MDISCPRGGKWDIGKGAYAPDLLLEMLQDIRTAESEAAGLKRAYERLDPKKTSYQQWQDFYESAVYRAGTVTAQEVSPSDIALGKVTKAHEELIQFLNFQSIEGRKKKTQGALGRNSIAHAKNLKRQILVEGERLSHQEAARQLNTFKKELKQQDLVAEMNSERSKVLNNLQHNVSETEAWEELHKLLTKDAHDVAAHGELLNFKDIQKRFNKRKPIADIKNLQALVKEAKRINDIMDKAADKAVEKRVEKALKDDTQDKKDIIKKIKEKYTLDWLKDLDINARYKLQLSQALKDVTDAELLKLSKGDLLRIQEGFYSLDERQVPSKLMKVITNLSRQRGATKIANNAVENGLNTNIFENTVQNAKGFMDKAFGGKYSKNAFNIVGTKLEGHAGFLADQTLGWEGTTILDEIVYPLSAANQKVDDYINRLIGEIEALREAHKKHFGIQNVNARTRSHYMVSLYQYENEAISNPGKRGMLTARQAVESIKEEILEADDYDKNDIEILNELQKKYENPDGSWDTKRMYNDFAPIEQKMINFTLNANEYVKPMLEEIFVRRGERFPLYKNYKPHNYITLGTDVKDQEMDDFKNNFRNGKSLAAEVVTHRIGKGERAIPNMKDPLGDVLRAQRMISLEYHLLPGVQDVRAKMRLAKKEVKGNEDAHTVIKGIEQWIDDIIRKDIGRKTSAPSNFEQNLLKLFKHSYSAQLVSLPRMVAEATSNLGFALTYKPQAFVEGSKHPITWNTDQGKASMEVIDSASLSRAYGDTYSNPHEEGTFFQTQFHTPLGAMSPSQAKVIGAMHYIRDNGFGRVRGAIDKINDFVITKPDRAVVIPLFWGTFHQEFKKRSGKDFDHELATAKDSKGQYTKEAIAYKLDNKESIEAARTIADRTAIQAGATNDVYMGISKIQKDPDATAATNIFKAVNYYMLRFSLFEFASFQTAVKGLQGKGHLSKEESARLLVAASARMALYAPIYAALIKLIYNMFGLEDEDDEDLSFGDDLKHSVIGSYLTFGLLRNFGVFKREGINWVIESFNEEYLEGLRNGAKYDPYKHSLVFRIFSEKDFSGNKGLWGSSYKLTGPLRPIIKSADDIIKYGSPMDALIFVLTYGGVLPIPKDIQRLANQYQRINK